MVLTGSNAEWAEKNGLCSHVIDEAEKKEKGFLNFLKSDDFMNSDSC